jgi:hypothetical protein
MEKGETKRSNSSKGFGVLPQVVWKKCTLFENPANESNRQKHVAWKTWVRAGDYEASNLVKGQGNHGQKGRKKGRRDPEAHTSIPVRTKSFNGLRTPESQRLGYCKIWCLFAMAVDGRINVANVPDAHVSMDQADRRRAR